MRRLWRDERGFSYAWTAMLFTTLLVPLMLFAVQYGRAVNTKDALQNAADAAASAAAAQVDVDHFRRTGEIRLTGAVYPVAQAYAARTFRQLGPRGVTPRVVAIVPDGATRTVRVVVEARVSALFGYPVTVRAEGTAQVRATTR